MSNFTPDEDKPILIEVAPQPGVRTVSLSPKDMAAKAEEAMQNVMDTIHNIARRFNGLYDNLPNEFNQVELSFGIKINAEAGAIVAKASVESNFNVKLVWQKKS